MASIRVNNTCNVADTTDLLVSPTTFTMRFQSFLSLMKVEMSCSMPHTVPDLSEMFGSGRYRFLFLRTERSNLSLLTSDVALALQIEIPFPWKIRIWRKAMHYLNYPHLQGVHAFYLPPSLWSSIIYSLHPHYPLRCHERGSN